MVSDTSLKLPWEKQWEQWRSSRSPFFDWYKNNPAGLFFLKKILKLAGQRSLDDVEVTPDAFYRAFSEEGRWEAAYYPRRIIEKAGYNLDEIEANIDLIRRLARMYETEAEKALLPLERIIYAKRHPEAAHDVLRELEGQGYNGALIARLIHGPYSILGTDVQSGRDVTITQKARQQGLYIIGATGTGKSTLLANLILQDIRQGIGVCLIEPAGGLINTVLAGIPETKLGNVILLDLTDSAYPFGLNLFECNDIKAIHEVNKTVSVVQHVFEKIWGVGTDTPRLIHVLRNATRTLIENPGTTFAEIPLLFSDDSVRAKMVANLTNREVVAFWEDYNRKSAYQKAEYIESTMNKVMSFLGDPMVRNIIGQSETTIHFREIMDDEQGKILLIKLSPLFKDMSLLIGGTILGKMIITAFSREDILDEESRRQFNLYCDEFQRFATADIADFIAEGARKYRVPITLAHQTLSQLDETNRAAAAAAGNMIVFRVSGENGEALAKSFDTAPPKEEVEAPVLVSDVIGYLVRYGSTETTVDQFTQRYLKNLESFVSRRPPVSATGIGLAGGDILQGRGLLNESLYQCMKQKRSDLVIPILALFMLAASQQDGSERAFWPHIKKVFFLDQAPTELKEFETWAKTQEFGRPGFTNNREKAIEFMVYWYNWCFFGGKKACRNAAEAVFTMIRELRNAMDTLARNPIMVHSPEYRPRPQIRTHTEMENEIARNLTQQPNYQAKAKLLTGEYVIKTKELPYVCSARERDKRIGDVKQRMIEQKYCKLNMEVEREIRERQAEWRSGERSGEPQPRHRPPQSWE